MNNLGIIGVNDTGILPFGAADFDPSKIPGLILWLDADYGITVTGNGVSSWLDRSASAANPVQATDANRLLLTAAAVNGHAAVGGHDAGDYAVDASKPTLVGLTGITTFCVFKALTVAGNQVLHTGGDLTATFGPAVQLGSNLAYNFTGPGNYGSYAFTDTTSPHIAEQVFDGAGGSDATRNVCYLDGTAKTLTFTGTCPASVPAGRNGVCVGLNVVSSTSYLMSIIRYSRALTAAERSIVGKWLGKRYAITVTY